MSLVRIQQRDANGFWVNVKLSRILSSDEDVVVLGKTFRILVDGEPVYVKGGRPKDLNQSPDKKVKK